MVLLLTTLLFLFIVKRRKTLRSYYVVQELFNFLFLLRSRRVLRSMLLLFKRATPPFSVWVLLVVNKLEASELLWLLTLQKTPIITLIILLQERRLFILILVGLLVTLTLFWFTSSSAYLITLSATVSRRWPILIGLVDSSLQPLRLLLCYLLTFYILYSERAENRIMRVEVVLLLLLIALPLSLIFLFKLFLFLTLNGSSLLILVLLMTTVFASFAYLTLLLSLCRSSNIKSKRNLFYYLPLIALLFLI
jgi:hypothetical protein